MRKPYNGISDQFDVKDLISKEPFGNFKHWLEQACNCSSIYEPNAMSIATATALVSLIVTCLPGCLLLMDVVSVVSTSVVHICQEVVHSVLNLVDSWRLYNVRRKSVPVFENSL